MSEAVETLYVTLFARSWLSLISTFSPLLRWVLLALIQELILVTLIKFIIVIVELVFPFFVKLREIIIIIII